jgi:hypothetical protein
MIKSLEYWLTVQPFRTTQTTLKYHDPSVLEADIKKLTSDSSMSNSFINQTQEFHRDKTAATEEALSNFTEDQIIKMGEGSGLPTKCPGPDLPEAREKWIKEAKKVISELICERMDQNIPEGVETESLFYERYRAFIPPASLLEKGLLNDIWTAFREVEKDGKITKKLPKGISSKVCGLQVLLQGY